MPDCIFHGAHVQEVAQLAILECADELSDVVKIRNNDVLGCGAQGCVFATSDRDIVAKVTTEPVDAQLNANLAEMRGRPSMLPFIYWVWYLRCASKAQARLDELALENSAARDCAVFIIIREDLSDIPTERLDISFGDDRLDARDRDLGVAIEFALSDRSTDRFIRSMRRARVMIARADRREQEGAPRRKGGPKLRDIDAAEQLVQLVEAQEDPPRRPQAHEHGPA